MPVEVQVLSVASTEMSPAIIVTEESQRYLFNAGEGLQRLCMEHRVRLAKLHHVCLTELTSSTVGGLPGLILTVSDTGKKGLNVFGPSGTKSFMRSTRHFLHRPDFAMDIQDLTPSSAKVVHNESLSLQPVVVDDAYASTTTTSDTSPSHKRAKLMTTANPTTSVSYIGETPTQRGKFLIQNALALGVPKGKMILHIMQAYHHTRRSIVRYQQPNSVVSMTLLVHLGNAAVLGHPHYIQWVKSFGPHVNHPECPQWSVFRSSATLQTQLHHLFPSNFAAPHHEVAPVERVTVAFGDATIGLPLLKYTLTPSAKQGLDRSLVMQPLDLPAIHMDTEQTLATAKVSLTHKEAPTITANDSNAVDGRVTFLGTGSAIPSKYRNVTSNLIAIGSSFLLLDAGEGCYGQLFRHVGGDDGKLKHLLENLHVVWISHNHADHHLGLVRLLSQRNPLVSW
ncbi:hypothetical protein DYB34_003446 [Aphanomyces astaci]|uniref:ribonuclease Z n=1 Tax=Aphanomyces astaci TaxID=112090 RepID=A0A418C304_APHAT|nr:hypothetical protein DYB34_003446 [Aphanomyces astaci]